MSTSSHQEPLRHSPDQQSHRPAQRRNSQRETRGGVLIIGATDGQRVSEDGDCLDDYLNDPGPDISDIEGADEFGLEEESDVADFHEAAGIPYHESDSDDEHVQSSEDQADAEGANATTHAGGIGGAGAEASTENAGDAADVAASHVGDYLREGAATLIFKCVVCQADVSTQLESSAIHESNTGEKDGMMCASCQESCLDSYEDDIAAGLAAPASGVEGMPEASEKLEQGTPEQNTLGVSQPAGAEQVLDSAEGVNEGDFVFTNVRRGTKQKKDYVADFFVGRVVSMRLSEGRDKVATLQHWQEAVDEQGIVPDTYIRDESETWEEPLGALFAAKRSACCGAAVQGQCQKAKETSQAEEEEFMHLDTTHMNEVLENEMNAEMGVPKKKQKKSKGGSQAPTKRFQHNDKENGTAAENGVARPPSTAKRARDVGRDRPAETSSLSGVKEVLKRARRFGS